MSDQGRCPECDYSLMYERAQRVTVTVGGLGSHRKFLNTVDLIYCDRCGWWRAATANDHPVVG